MKRPYMTARMRLQKIREWQLNTGCCAVFVVVKIAGSFDKTVDVNLTSDSDLAELKTEWQEKDCLTEQAAGWPGMSLGLMVKVLLHVYNLQCKRFCKEIAGFDIASNWRFRHLATLKSFYKTKGVGFVDCYHKKDQVYHVLFFRTNGTPRSVYFEDLTSNRKMRGWAQYARQFTVLGVYMVRSHPCCRPTARYPCLSCQAKWPEDATEPDLPAATEPDLPAATEPDLPAATEPDLPRD